MESERTPTSDVVDRWLSEPEDPTEPRVEYYGVMHDSSCMTRWEANELHDWLEYVLSLEPLTPDTPRHEPREPSPLVVSEELERVWVEHCNRRT